MWTKAKWPKSVKFSTCREASHAQAKGPVRTVRHAYKKGGNYKVVARGAGGTPCEGSQQTPLTIAQAPEPKKADSKKPDDKKGAAKKAPTKKKADEKKKAPAKKDEKKKDDKKAEAK